MDAGMISSVEQVQKKVGTFQQERLEEAVVTRRRRTNGRTIENCAANEPLFLAVGCQLSAVGQKGQGYCLRRDQ
jgi:hypothetical protein